MNHRNHNIPTSSSARYLSRRWFLRDCGVGLAGIAAAFAAGREAAADIELRRIRWPRDRRIFRPRPSESSTCSRPAHRATWNCSTTSRN